ncbi:MAG TPA: thymidine kinase [Firmicutes bacterium]|nr:thymidine kinase [Bacillota bacterium]
MAELTFVYSTMSAGKSLDLLKNAHQYSERGNKVLYFTTVKDKQRGKGVISTRLGITTQANLTEECDLFALAEKELPCMIYVDEAQFLSAGQVIELTRIVDRLNIPVTAYGLKTDFQGNLFPGSMALIQYADNLVELSVPCWYCSNKATMNMRVDNDDKPVFSGKQVQIGDNYLPVCRKCYFEKKSAK